MGLDKFYTKEDVASNCYNFLLDNYNVVGETFLEPSAGAGSFSKLINNCIALDIKPEGPGIIAQDFLTYETEKTDYITIGNPPFGNRSALAIEFFNKASQISNIIAFIVPVSFMKWNVQKQLNPDFALSDFFFLDFDSFTDEGKDFGVRTVFQIWVKKTSKYFTKPDKRLKQQPPISHQDFLIWQYNATDEALPSVEEDWEIATYRQGYHDYNIIFSRNDYETIKKNMINRPRKQYFFIKPLTDEARDIILNMDFNNLAERNTSTPGFGKSDFVGYYEELKREGKK